MKSVVIPNDNAVPGIVNDAIYRQYTTLLQEDIRALLKFEDMREVDCCGCGSKNADLFADVMGLSYKVCQNCAACFVSPRPNQEDLQRFYRESKACKYWRGEMAGLNDQKLYYIWGPRVAWMTQWADECLGRDPLLVDYQTKYSFLIKHMQSPIQFPNICTLIRFKKTTSKPYNN